MSAPSSRLGSRPGWEPRSRFQRPLRMELPSPGPSSPGSTIPASPSSALLASVWSAESGVPCTGLRPRARTRVRHRDGGLHHPPTEHPPPTSQGAGQRQSPPSGLSEKRLGTKPKEKNVRSGPIPAACGHLSCSPARRADHRQEGLHGVLSRCVRKRRAAGRSGRAGGPPVPQTVLWGPLHSRQLSVHTAAYEMGSGGLLKSNLLRLNTSRL